MLVLSPYLPYPPEHGGKTRVYNLLKRASRAWDITLIAFLRNEKERELFPEMKDFCEQVDGVVLPHFPESYSPAERVRLFSNHLRGHCNILDYFHSPKIAAMMGQALNTRDFDIIQVESVWMAPYVLAGARSPKILVQHNVESEIFRANYLEKRWSPRNLGGKLGDYLAWRNLRRFEARTCKDFDCCIAVSGPDAELLREISPGVTLTVLPNGVDTEYFKPGGERPDQGVCLYTGTYDYPPNVDAVRYAARRILPALREKNPSARWLVVGHGMEEGLRRELGGAGMEPVGSVSDIREYFHRAQVFAAPIRIGGGTRLKLLEAMSMGKAVVCTSVACEGLEVESGTHLLIEDDPIRFAGAVAELFEDPRRRERLGVEGRRLVKERYEWDRIGSAYGELLETISRGAPLPSTGWR